VSLTEGESGKRHPSFFSRGVADEISQLLSEEDERLFYVAITRAKNSLHFFPPADIKSLSNTGWARHLSEFIAHGEGLYQSKSNGSYEFKVETDKDPGAFSFANSEVTSEQQTMSILDPAPYRKTRSISVTKLIGSSDSTKSQANFGSFNVEPIIKGVFTHRQFESFGCSKSLDDLPETLKEFIRNSEIPFFEIVSDGFVEWPFSFEISDFQMEGQIDLWGHDRLGEVWILDYKTGSEIHAMKAFEQLKLYAWSLKQMGFLDLTTPINLAVCYPFENKSLVQKLSFADIREPTIPND
jgi:ATP-dependent helicase/nuclease subunit A